MPCTALSALSLAMRSRISVSLAPAGSVWLKYSKPTVPVFFSIWPR